MESLQFSAQPGCWERYLQRQYNNPLFTLAQPITQADVQAAQHKDEAERIAFYQTFHTLLQEVSALQARVEADIILKLKERIDVLYEQCASLGGDYSAEKQGLRQLSELVIQSIQTIGAHDPHLLATLAKESIARQAHFTLLEHAFIAHLLRPQSPITELDIIPSLLTEDEDTLRAAMNLLSSQQQHILCEEARNLLTRLKIEGFALPVAWAKLAMMETF